MYTKISVGKSERKRPLEKPSCRWEDNITTDLKETGVEDVYWIHLAQGEVQWQTPVNTVMNIRVLWTTGNFLTS